MEAVLNATSILILLLKKKKFIRAILPAILYYMPLSLTILEDSRNQVAIRNYYKGIYSPMTLYKIEIKRKRERERRTDISY